MYRTIRNVHLFCGLAALPILLMYAVSSIQMSHNRWFSTKPVVTETPVILPAGLTDGRVVARTLMERGLVIGEIRRIAAKGDALEIRILHPGTIVLIKYSGATGGAVIHKERSGFVMMLNRLHHLGGVAHEFAPLNAWGFALGAAAIGLLVLGTSGLYLWFKTYRERRIGIVLLGVNLVFSVVLIAVLRLG